MGPKWQSAEISVNSDGFRGTGLPAGREPVWRRRNESMMALAAGDVPLDRRRDARPRIYRSKKSMIRKDATTPTLLRSTTLVRRWRIVLAGLLTLNFGASDLARAQLGHANTPWNRVLERAPWTPRDSQGEVVYRNRLWILGGWFNSYEAPPRDVWSSADGVDWQRATETAPWIHSDLPMTLVHDDKMWLMGGWYRGRLPGHSASAQVWNSTDGEHWTRATDRAGWTPRIAAGAVAFQDRMWILGGTENYYFGDETSLKNDVWSSADGKDWRLESEHAPWSPRAYHQAAVLNGRIHVMGGGSYTPTYEAKNDVWSSADGVEWRLETEDAPWSPRLWFSSVVYRDRIWVLGGWSNHPSMNHGDVWYSKDGRDWREWKSETSWKARHEHSAFVHQDKIWIAGGHAAPLSGEVWSIEIPADALD